MNLLEKLFKSKQEIEETDESQGIEKSFDEAIDAVSKAVDEEKEEKEEEEEEEGKKKKKKKGKFPFPFAKKSESDDGDDDGDDGDDDEDESDDDDDEAETKKSEDEIFVDAEPIIKSLMEDINKSLRSISKRLSTVETIQKASAELSIAQGKMLKSVKGSGDEIQPRKSELSKGEGDDEKVTPQERVFKKSDDDNDSAGLTKSQALERLESLAKAQKLSPREVALFEGRINAGNANLPDVFYQKDEDDK